MFFFFFFFCLHLYIPGFLISVGSGQSSPRCLGVDNCCDRKLCDLGEGDCDEDNQCTGNLICGQDNCIGVGFDKTDDCCAAPPTTTTSTATTSENCDDLIVDRKGWTGRV